MMMSEVAKRLVTFCQEGEQKRVVDELYANDIVSIDACPHWRLMALRISIEGLWGSEEMPSRIEGLDVDVVKEKHQWFSANFEEHGMIVEGPFIASSPDKFIVIFGLDATNKGTGERTQTKGCVLYTVRDGRIVKEEFFLPQG